MRGTHLAAEARQRAAARDLGRRRPVEVLLRGARDPSISHAGLPAQRKRAGEHARPWPRTPGMQHGVCIGMARKGHGGDGCRGCAAAASPTVQGFSPRVSGFRV